MEDFWINYISKGTLIALFLREVSPCLGPKKIFINEKKKESKKKNLSKRRSIMLRLKQKSQGFF